MTTEKTFNITKDDRFYGSNEYAIQHDLGYPVILLYRDIFMLNLDSTVVAFSHGEVDTGHTLTYIKLGNGLRFGTDVTKIVLVNK